MQSKVKAPDLADENDVSRVKSNESKPDLEPKATPWFQKWGTVSQITSALISFATLSVAVYGLSAASPFFQEQAADGSERPFGVRINSANQEYRGAENRT